MKKVLFFLLLVITISSGATLASVVDVSPFCLPNDTARKLSTDVDKVLCTQWVNGSATWEGAMTNAIKALVEEAKAAKPTALDLLEQQMTLFLSPSWVRDPLLGNCTQAFDGYVNAMGQCLEWVNDPTKDKDLSTAFQVDHFRTCIKLVPEGYSVAEIDQFGVNKSFYDIPLAIISSKSGGHACCQTAINDESHNSTRFCFTDNDNDKAMCQKWVYGSIKWEEAVTKGIMTVVGMANSTKPNALEAIRAKLVPLGVDPEPIIASCSQAFDAYVQARMSTLQLVKESSPYDPTSQYEDDVDHFKACKNELLSKANLSLPEIDQFDPEKSINTIIKTITNSNYAD